MNAYSKLLQKHILTESHKSILDGLLRNYSRDLFLFISVQLTSVSFLCSGTIEWSNRVCDSIHRARLSAIIKRSGQVPYTL